MGTRGKANLPGQIKRRTAGSWTVIIDMGTDSGSGKRRQVWRAVKGPKREAQALLVELIRQRDSGVDLPSGKTTVAEFLAYWLEVYATPNVAPATLLQYEWRSRSI